MLHGLQVLIETAIGITKHLLKELAEPVPISAYDSFSRLHNKKKIDDAQLQQTKCRVTLPLTRPTARIKLIAYIPKTLPIKLITPQFLLASTQYHRATPH